MFFVFFCAVLLIGCSSYSKDKFLRTFFDGVPEPVGKKQVGETKAEVKKEPLPASQQSAASAAQAPSAYFHLPFLENQCDNCHQSKLSQKPAARNKDLCFVCHDDFTQDKKTVHYPVSEGECLACHNPHQTPNKFLLEKPVPQICFTCHDEKEIKDNPSHGEIAVCTECHNPHASNEEKLLK